MPDKELDPKEMKLVVEYLLQPIYGTMPRCNGCDLPRGYCFDCAYEATLERVKEFLDSYTEREP